MKNKKLYAIILTVICVLCVLSFSACGNGRSNNPSTAIELEAYDDYVITLPDGITGAEWSSSDESIATVVDGKVSCLGKKGEVRITATYEGKKYKYTVNVIDSDLSPRLNGGDLICYVNGLSTVDLEIRYNEKYYTEYTVKSITVDDPTIAIGENGKLKGLTEGQTTASVVLVWKGLTISSREKVNITVKPEFTFLTDSEEYSVYSVNSVSTVKKNTTQIDAQLMVRGNAVKDADITATIINGEEYFSIDNNFNITAKPVDGIKDCKVNLSASYEDKIINKEVTVKVHPNFDQREDSEFQSSLTNAVYKAYEGTVGGRDNVYIYQTGEDCRGSGDWIRWGNHLELTTLKTVELKSQYDYVVNTLGIVMVSFDVYYEGSINAETGLKEFRGVSVNAQYGPNNTDNLYYIGHVKNTPERIVVVDGVQTNKLVPETWTTFFIDLRLLGKGAQLDTYLASNKVGDVSYVDNIRFWYDDQAIENLDKSNVDLDDRQLNFVEGSSKIVAPENEFMNYSTDYTSFEKTDDGFLYVAKEEPDYGGTTLLSKQLARRIFPYNIFKGVVVKKDVKYFSFDYMFLSGYPFLSIYDQQNETTTIIGLHETAVSDYKVNVYDSQGNKVERIQKDTWYTIIVETHINTGSTDTFYLTTTNVGTSFKIKNYTYWLDDSGKYEIGYNELFDVTVNDLDYAFVGEEININDIITAKYKGDVITEYTVENVSILDEDVASSSDGIITLLNDGVTEMSFTVKYDNGEYSSEKQFTVTIKTFGKNTLILGENEITLNIANEGLSSKNVAVTVLVVNGEMAFAEDLVKLSIVEGNDVVSVDGLKITALKVGTAKVKAYVELADGELYQDIEVTVIDSDWALIKTNTQNTFENGKLTLSKDIWNDYLILIDTDGRYGTNPTVKNDWDIRQELIKENVNYITFTVKVISGSVRIYCPILPDDQTYIALSTDKFTVDKKYLSQVNDLIELYTLSGERLTEYDKLTANTEYRVVIKYESESKGWAEICLKGDYGVFEVSNATYLETNTYYKEYQTWGLKTDSKNTFVNGVYTLSNDIWNDYLTLRACDARLGTNSVVAANAHWAIRENIKAQNINYIEFTIKVSSGTARIYTPLPDVNGESKLGYIGVSTTGLVIDPNNTNVIDYIWIYDSNGNKLNSNSTLTANTEYRVVIKYEHTLSKGWAEVCIKGQATTATVSQAKFYTVIN